MRTRTLYYTDIYDTKIAFTISSDVNMFNKLLTPPGLDIQYQCGIIVIKKGTDKLCTISPFCEDDELFFAAICKDDMTCAISGVPLFRSPLVIFNGYLCDIVQAHRRIIAAERITRAIRQSSLYEKCCSYKYMLDDTIGKHVL